MRIGLVVPGFSAEPRDWCIPALRHLARELGAADDVRIIAIRYPYQASRYTIDGCETIALGGALRHGPATLSLWRRAVDLLRSEHQRLPFDVLHAFWATESGLVAAIAGRSLRVPTLVSLAGGELVALRDIDYGDQRSAWERLKVAASLRLASGVSAGSRQLASTAAHYLRGRRSVRVAPLGVDLDLFSPDPAAPRPAGPSLVHVGTLTPVKDHPTLLRALAIVRQRGVPAGLDVVGEGPMRSQLQRLVHQLGLAAAVRFRGELDHAALPAVYRAADACVVSSRHEAQCMAAIEAAACGVRVVGTRVGVVPELSTAVAPVGNAEALAECIDTTLAGTSETPRHARAAEGVRQTFGLQPSTDRFRELYRTLARA